MSVSTDFNGRLGLQQRVLPSYRAAFFDLLADSCRGGLSVFAGEPRKGEAIRPAASLSAAMRQQARNLHLLGGPGYLCLQLGMRNWLRNWDPHALILEANPRYLSNRAAITWMKRHNRPVLGWGLGAPDPAGPLAGVRRAARRSYYRRFDALIAYSTRGAEQYRQAGFPEERIFVAPNAVIGPPAEMPERQAIRGRLGRILFVGRLQRRKRVDLLLRACGEMDPRPQLWIVGEGPARAGLEALAGRVYPTAEFRGELHGPDLEQTFRAADLLVLPGTGGLAIQHAMANGLPVIAAEGDGTQEDLVGDQNGWLVPPGDLAALVRALQEALASPDELLRKGAASFRRVQERFNIQSMLEVFMQALMASGGAA